MWLHTDGAAIFLFFIQFPQSYLPDFYNHQTIHSYKNHYFSFNFSVLLPILFSIISDK